MKDINSYRHVASAPRKSYLGKARRLTPPQERWVKAILSLWADEMGGLVYSGGYGDGGCDGIWRFVSGWSGEQQEKFMTVFEWLRNGGYRGEELLKTAHMILFPKQSLSDMFQRANDVDEADFVEKAILKAFSKSNPVYVLATDYYLRRNTVQTLANYMQSEIAPWLTVKQCIDRVKWCISLFHAKVYMILQDEIAKERIEKGVKLKNISKIT
ncbi:hypothetical protein ACNFJN_08950 [Xenorhabdus budapestensis]|uniref:hypothetical protein n=1 Tax=Xenorhabdus budapestensis TaxID=290110 RepID=UPI003A85D24D